MFRRTTSCGRNNMCPTSLSFVLSTCLSNIKFQYGVYVSPTSSPPFLILSYVWCSITCQFASKSNCCCKLLVTSDSSCSQFFIFKVCRSLYSPYIVNDIDLWYFLIDPIKFWIEQKTTLFIWTHASTIYNFFVENLLITKRRNQKIISPQDGRQMVKVKFTLQSISHYCNNKFAFHRHMFTIFVLSFNKLQITIHSHIKFIAIACSQKFSF
jgi:hypothetical protein